ncbi:hypothetical protein Pelo_15156 [Pelomyxa schiedti]|nr:hypothetical protein Pelo_15156 [Pelomyxa schiedti]
MAATSFQYEETVVETTVETTEEELTTIEESPLSKWEREHTEMLLGRAEKSEQLHREMLSKAKEDVAEFYAEREKAIKAKQAQNEESETQFRASQETLFTHGTVWEQVASMVDFSGTAQMLSRKKLAAAAAAAAASADKSNTTTPTSSSTAAAVPELEKEDTTRMRSVLISLKATKD